MSAADDRRRQADGTSHTRSQGDSATSGGASQPTGQAEADAAAQDGGLGGLDLSIEIVEERISPGETNVFDK